MTQLISKEYKELCTLYHQQEPKWGNLGDKEEKFETSIKTLKGLWEQWGRGLILDYGCGKGWLAKNFPYTIMREYDPGIPGKDSLPEPADLVLCFDVLEHVEPEYLEAVLKDLQRVTQRRGLFTIACHPANARLPDGRNAHLIIESTDWWLRKLLDYFHIEFATSAKKQLFVIVKRLHDGTY